MHRSTALTKEGHGPTILRSSNTKFSFLPVYLARMTAPFINRVLSTRLYQLSYIIRHAFTNISNIRPSFRKHMVIRNFLKRIPCPHHIGNLTKHNRCPRHLHPIRFPAITNRMRRRSKVTQIRYHRANSSQQFRYLIMSTILHRK